MVAPIRCPCDLIEVAADAAELGHRPLKSQQLLLRKRSEDPQVGPGEQLGGQVVRLAVPRVQPTALRVPRPQRGAFDTGRVEFPAPHPIMVTPDR